MSSWRPETRVREEFSIQYCSHFSYGFVTFTSKEEADKATVATKLRPHDYVREKFTTFSAERSSQKSRDQTGYRDLGVSTYFWTRA